uniref:Uncharacterized protein n=1 Tax=Romanomermis culicivorax TaxID=13658 RepID=A0A915I569_ROMCU
MSFKKKIFLDINLIVPIKKIYQPARIESNMADGWDDSELNWIDTDLQATRQVEEKSDDSDPDSDSGSDLSSQIMTPPAQEIASIVV